jgi:hypothetical protein
MEYWSVGKRALEITLIIISSFHYSIIPVAIRCPL